MIPSENPLFRAFAIAGFAVLGGVVIWSSIPQPFEGHGGSIVQPQVDESEQRARFLRASFIRTEADQIAAAGGTSRQCSSDVSAAEMEIILEEMIRRGWRPPSRTMALADLQTVGSQLFPLDPDTPMPVRYSQSRQETEDGPIPPTPADSFETNQPITVTTPVTSPATPGAAPSAADLIASPQPSPH